MSHIKLVGTGLVLAGLCLVATTMVQAERMSAAESRRSSATTAVRFDNQMSSIQRPGVSRLPVTAVDQPQASANVYHSIVDQSRSLVDLSSPLATSAGDLQTAAGHHHGAHHHHGKYYEYRAVPKKKHWKYGYKRGNHKHTISRHEHGKAGKHPHFKTKVKWHDSKSKGKGIHLWDYNHHDKKHHYGHHG